MCYALITITVICVHLCTKKLPNIQSKNVLKIIINAFLVYKNHKYAQKKVFYLDHLIYINNIIFSSYFYLLFF